MQRSNGLICQRKIEVSFWMLGKLYVDFVIVVESDRPFAISALARYLECGAISLRSLESKPINRVLGHFEPLFLSFIGCCKTRGVRYLETSKTRQIHFSL